MSGNNEATILPPREPGKCIVGNVDFEPTIPVVLDLWRKHGDLITLTLFGQKLILVCGHRTLSEVLEKNADFTVEHPTVFESTEFFESSALIGAFRQVWRKQRKFVIDTFRKIDSGSANLESRVADVVEDFLKDVELANGCPIDIIKLIKTTHYNIVSSLLFGEKFKHGDETLSRLVDLVDEATYSVPDRAMLSFFEWLKYLPCDRFKVRRQRYLIDEILKIIQQFVDKHIEKSHKTDSIDFIYSFIQEQERMQTASENMEGFKDRDVLLLGFGLLFGGVSVVQALSWSYLYLVHHPDVVCKMQQEIDDNIGKSRSPTTKDKPSLPYCQAVIYEILRMSSVISVAPIHVLTANIKVNEYSLPKDAWLLLGLCTVNSDPSNFPEPEKFNPGRFINDAGKLSGFEKVYASFSMGPRSCAAQNLAETELFLFITSVVQRYNIANEPDKPMPSLEGIFKGAHIPSPYNVCLKHRL